MDPVEHEKISISGVSFAHNDIYKVIDDFYSRVQRDPVLKIPFQSVHDWPEHVKRITHFWWIKFGGKPYMLSEYNPIPKHFHAGFNNELLSRWLGLFHEVLSQHLLKEQSEIWKLVSKRMGNGLSIRNEMYRKHFESHQPQSNEGE